jgi:molybdopterin converting factor small subunit
MGMARVLFTSNLKQHIDCAPLEAEGRTVREVLDNAFGKNPQARSYVLDEQGALRQHMMVFVNGDGIRDRHGLSDLVPADAEVYIFQALSGG